MPKASMHSPWVFSHIDSPHESTHLEARFIFQQKQHTLQMASALLMETDLRTPGKGRSILKMCVSVVL